MAKTQGPLQAQRGTKDILPDEAACFEFLERTAREIFAAYDYGEIRTPIFESTDLFVRGIGASTDIVSKEMYTFADRKGRSLTLRPEGTAPVVRAVIEHNLLRDNQVVKLFYIGPMFRYERPQYGRQRQFTQFGVEFFGVAEPTADAEVISLSHQFLKCIGFRNVTTTINTIGCKACRPKYNTALKAFLCKHLEKLCPDCQNRADVNPLRVFDCKQDTCKEELAHAPDISKFTCKDCEEHFKTLVRLLSDFQVDITVSRNLVRGFDYYTRTVFETSLKGLGAQDAVLGGGRYDNLIEELGGPPTPAVGVSFGIERIIAAIQKEDIAIPASKEIQLFILAIDEEAVGLASRLADLARRSTIRTRFDGILRSLKGGLRAADRAGAKHVIIIGKHELEQQQVIVKHLESGQQRTMGLKECEAFLPNLGK
jgi:histidyl-tRNA synthetase